MGRAIIAGAGRLPQLLLEAGPATLVQMQGVEIEARADDPVVARFEQFGALFEALKARGVTEVCFAGAISRPEFDPAHLDATTAAILPRLATAIGQGDDALLRMTIEIFEENGFTLVGAQDIRPDLLAGAGTICGAPDDALRADAARAGAVLSALGALDVGQGAVAARGQMLGIETLQGTDAMLDFVAATAPGSGGVFVKRPKPGQDRRADLPAIGPDTIARAARAGLRGIALLAGGCLILDRDAVIEAAAQADIAIWAEAP